MSVFEDQRVAGAIAGLGPAAVILAFYVMTGGPVGPSLLVIVAAASAAGWLTGPHVEGETGADVLAALRYLLVSYLLQSVIGVAIRSLEGGPGIAGKEPSVLEMIGTQGLVTIMYLPMWAIVLSPLALLWVLTVRGLPWPLRARTGSRIDVEKVPRPRARPGSLMWPPIAALTAYLVGFSLVTSWGCTATSTVGGEGSLTTGTMTVCSSLIGVTYSGQGTYNPPREPAIQAGLVLAAIAFVIVLLAVLWLRRAPVRDSN